MPARLTDEEVAQVRALAAEGGLSLARIAERFGTSRQHVSRLVRGEQRTVRGDVEAPLADVDAPGSVVLAVVAELEAAGVDPTEDATAAAALALAEKLDSVRRSRTSTSAMAAPALARVLEDLLAELRGVRRDTGPRLGGLRGEEAVLVAAELGYPDPEGIDVDRFDEIERIRLRRHRRLARQRRAS